MADPYATLQMFAAGVIVGTDVLIGAAIVIIFYGLIGGRAFCSWVCPINMVTDLANWIRVKNRSSQGRMAAQNKQKAEILILE